MPEAVEAALRKAGRKKGYKAKRLEDFVYGTMTEMSKRGEINWPGHGKKKHG
jgi:hypothetical protein